MKSKKQLKKARKFYKEALDDFIAIVEKATIKPSKKNLKVLCRAREEFIAHSVKSTELILTLDDLCARNENAHELANKFEYALTMIKNSRGTPQFESVVDVALQKVFAPAESPASTGCGSGGCGSCGCGCDSPDAAKPV